MHGVSSASLARWYSKLAQNIYFYIDPNFISLGGMESRTLITSGDLEITQFERVRLHSCRPQAAMAWLVLYMCSQLSMKIDIVWMSDKYRNEWLTDGKINRGA